jgi:GT2 family glycosyltransferase
VNEPRIAVVILNWNSAADTLECVASLHASCDTHLSVIIVDNGSTDSSWEELQQVSAMGVTLIQSGANLGYAGGNNIGIRAALDRHADFVWILNNDTVIHPVCARELLETAEQYPKAGIFVPKIFYKDRPRTIWYAGGAYDSLRAQNIHWGIGAQDDGRFDDPCEVAFASGCSLFVRHEVFERIGLLDDRYFLYWEDVEFSLRALRAGYRIRFVPTARVWHQEQASSGRFYGHSPNFHYYTVRNRLWFIREEHHGWSTFFAYAWTMPLLLRRLGGITLRGESSYIEKLIAMMQGLRDGVFRRSQSKRSST